MNMFLFELRSNMKSVLKWSIALCLIVIFYMAVYPSFAQSEADTRKLLSTYPQGLLTALGLDLDKFFSVVGFYSFMILYVLVCAAIQAVNLGIGVISKEYRNKTSDFILTKPVSRFSVLTCKLLAVFASIVITNIIYFLVVTPFCYIMSDKKLDIAMFLMISLTVFFLQLIFASIGVLIALLFRKLKSVISVSLTTVFSFFILSMVQGVIKEDSVKYLTPFKYFDASYIMKNNTYDTAFMVLWAALIIVFVSVSYLLYIKQDVYAV